MKFSETEVTDKNGKVTIRREPIWYWTYRTRDGHMTPSYWVEKGQRWNMWTKNEGPDLFAAYKPLPPDGDVK